jgi:hypothetical protein
MRPTALQTPECPVHHRLGETPPSIPIVNAIEKLNAAPHKDEIITRLRAPGASEDKP